LYRSNSAYYLCSCQKNKPAMKITFFFLALLISVSSSAQPGKPIVLGESYEISSAVLGEKRTLNVYLPEGYNPEDTTHYPVIYLLDGGIDEDFIHVVGLVQFNSFEWIARVPKSIVVGITNTDRKRDLTFPTAVKKQKEQFPTTGGSEKFMQFLEKEVQPYVSRTFKTNSDRTLIGESLGGLFATEVLFMRPQLFNRYIIISPSLWWSNGALLKKNVAASGILPHTGVYVGVGKEGLAPGDEPHVMEVDANLLVDKLENLHNKNLSVYFDYLPDETHATIAHQATFNAFKKLFGNPASR
jgi:uncharacterized protein